MRLNFVYFHHVVAREKMGKIIGCVGVSLLFCVASVCAPVSEILNRLFVRYVAASSIYRPQRSWDKVVFSGACVKNSVHRGGHA